MNGNLVANVILADKKFVDKNYPGSIDVTDLEVRPSIGWTYIDGVFVAPVIAETTDGIS